MGKILSVKIGEELLHRALGLEDRAPERIVRELLEKTPEDEPLSATLDRLWNKLDWPLPAKVFGTYLLGYAMGREEFYGGATGASQGENQKEG